MRLHQQLDIDQNSQLILIQGQCAIPYGTICPSDQRPLKVTYSYEASRVENVV
jgi:hypothetical protein